MRIEIRTLALAACGAFFAAVAFSATSIDPAAVQALYQAKCPAEMQEITAFLTGNKIMVDGNPAIEHRYATGCGNS